MKSWRDRNWGETRDLKDSDQYPCPPLGVACGRRGWGCSGDKRETMIVKFVLENLMKDPTTQGSL